MNLRELNSVLARLGRPPLRVGPIRQRGETLAVKPWRLVVELDRGECDVRPFASEDEACRWLLTRELMEHPPPAGEGQAPVRLDAEPDPQVAGTVPGARDRDQPPVLRWRRPLRPLSKLSGRGSGIAVVTDSSSLYRHGLDGCLHVVALDVATGRQLWNVPVWPPSHPPAVHVLGDTVLVGTDNWWAGFDHLTGECRWHANPAVGARVVGQAAGLAVLAAGKGPGLTGLDLLTGARAWRYPGPFSDPVYAYDGIPTLSRVLSVTVDQGRIAVDAVRTADGSCDRLFDVAEPPAYRGAELHVLCDMLDEDGRAGYVHVRGTGQRTAGEVGGRLGDLILVPGRGEAVVVHDEPVNTLRRTEVWAHAVDAGHYLLAPSYLDWASSSLVDLSGRTLWEMPGLCSRPQRLPALTLVGWARGSTHDPAVVAIDDHGRVRWRVAGKLGFVHDGVVWIGDKSQVAGYDATTGERLWSTAGVDPLQYPNRLQGFHHDDEHLLLETGGELVALG